MELNRTKVFLYGTKVVLKALCQSMYIALLIQDDVTTTDDVNYLCQKCGRKKKY